MYYEYENTADIIEEFNFIDLENIRLLDLRLMPVGNQLFANLINQLAERIYSQISLNHSGYKMEYKMLALTNILTNLYSAFISNKVLAYSRAKNYYSVINHDRYGFNWISYRNYMWIINSLDEAGIVENRTGFYDHNTRQGKRSRLWPAEALATEFQTIKDTIDYSISMKQVVYDNNTTASVMDKYVERIKPECSIILKDKSKKWIDYSCDREVNSLTKRINRYNSFMTEIDVLHPVQQNECNRQENGKNRMEEYTGMERKRSNECIGGGITSTISGKDGHKAIFYKNLSSQLFRVFNRSQFSFGGRYYDGEYQLLNDNERSQLLINGNPVIEADFSALHPRMLYSFLGINLGNEDPYDIFDGNLPLRSAVKLLFNIAINAKSYYAAFIAFRDKLNHNYSNPEKQKKMTAIMEVMRDKGLNIKDLYRVILDCHPSIQKYISSDVGVRLQNIDSMMATEVLEYFTGQNIPCLCIHDSFVVPQQYGNDLKDLMQETYKKHMHFDCPVSFKYFS